jgi:hypothetical protein
VSGVVRSGEGIGRGRSGREEVKRIISVRGGGDERGGLDGVDIVVVVVVRRVES